MGKIHLILGPMGSGKSLELIKVYYDNILAKKKVAVLKPGFDTRNVGIASRIGMDIPAIIIQDFQDWQDWINYDIIIIDEGQFGTNIAQAVDIWANKPKLNIYISGLNSSYERTIFPEIAKLVAIAYDIKMLRAVCSISGKQAEYTYKKQKTPGESLFCVGDTNQEYISLCRKEFQNMNF